MDFSKIFIKDANPTKMGGQAVMEGIMMKGADRTAIAVRRADGTINVKEQPLKPRSRWMKIPIIRGVVVFVDSLVTGVSTLMYSAEVLEEDIPDEEDYTPGKFESWLQKKYGDKGVFNFLLYSSVVIALAVSIGLFVLLPTWLVGLCGHIIGDPIALNLIEGVMRIIMFIIYIVAISQMNDIKRVFQYHGAEHKCINCVEHGLELNVENVRNSSREHKRCGTSFMLIVMVVSIIFFIFIRVESPILRVVFRIALVPVIAGVSYEFIRLAGRSENKLVLALSRPGMWMQGLTTREPDDGMIEVAIAAVEAVFDWRAWQGREPLETETEVVDEAEEAQLNAGDLEEILEEDAEEASDESTEPAAEEPKDVEEILEGKK